MAEIGVRGADKLIGGLKRNATLNDVKDTVKLNGTEMQRKAMGKAPVKTGNLRRNINFSLEDLGYTAKVISAADYAPYQEYGTRYQSGTPHIRPAFYQQRRQFKRDIKRLMD